MITLDWKERLKKDTDEFIKVRLPGKDYDLDIVYNGYPERVNGHVPQEVVTQVAKMVAAYLVKEPEQWLEFYNYLWDKKEVTGHLAAAVILGRVAAKNPDLALTLVKDMLKARPDEESHALLFDKVVYPIVKKQPLKWLDQIFTWLHQASPLMTDYLNRMFIKLIKSNHELAEPIFKRLESRWFDASEELVKQNIKFLKALYAVDIDLYNKVWATYKHTREPIFAEILCNSIKMVNPDVEEAVNLWSNSGNVRLKKAGRLGVRIVKRLK